MKLANKVFSAMLIVTCLVLAACSGIPGGSGGGNGGGVHNVTATIGGMVTNLAPGASLVVQNNGGDSLTITANGAFTFKTPVTGPTDAYAVTVLNQPQTPNQICTVTKGSGVATAKVTTVAVDCVMSYTIGGTISGLVGSGFVLENSSDKELLKISPTNGNQAYTFKNLVPTGTAYTVSVATQPTNPVQQCTVVPATATGNTTANVINVAVNCQAVTYKVGGIVVGLEGQNVNTAPYNNPLTDNSFTLQNNLGDTNVITHNGPFHFATSENLNDQYNISVFTLPSTQLQPCWTWNYKGVVTGDITSVVVDCGHDDWTFIDGTNTAGSLLTTPQYGSFPTSAPTLIPNPYTNTPGARYGAAGWTDNAGNLWLFGGDGWELTGNQAPDTLSAPMNDLWVCPMVGDQCQWQLVGGYAPAPVGPAIIKNAQHESQFGSYGAPGVPGARWGAATWRDNAGNLWLFGGNGNSDIATGLLNDLWEYTPGITSNPLFPYTDVAGTWTYQGGTPKVNQAGVYAGGTLVPGARVGAVHWTDKLGNFWLFGGYGFDGSKKEGFLNDLWEYNGSNWVFVNGTQLINQPGNYGTTGTAAATNLPGGRQEAVGWADGSGNLWLFGGEGLDDAGTPNGILNDLWVYNIASNEWTWVMGAEPVTNSTRANHTGVYELQTVIGPVSTTGAADTCGLAVGNTGYSCTAVDTTAALPGSRWGASGWVDRGGNFWLFGGWGLDSTGTNGNGALNDLWVYTPNTTVGQPGTWAWIKGSNTGSQNGLYGPKTRPYSTYNIWTPGGRNNATHWVDGLGQLWLFGGEGYDATSTIGNGYLNDMWRYTPYPDPF